MASPQRIIRAHDKEVSRSVITVRSEEAGQGGGARKRYACHENCRGPCRGDGCCGGLSFFGSELLFLLCCNAPPCSLHRVSFCQAREGALFASGSWDATVKVWDAGALRGGSTAKAAAAAVPVCVFNHSGYVYDVRWSPHRPFVLASACEDGTVSILDVRANVIAQVGLSWHQRWQPCKQVECGTKRCASALRACCKAAEIVLQE